MVVQLCPHVKELREHWLVKTVLYLRAVSEPVIQETTYLRWRKGQNLDWGALGSHEAIGVGRQGDASPASVVQDGGWRDPPRRDRD